MTAPTGPSYWTPLSELDERRDRLVKACLRLAEQHPATLRDACRRLRDAPPPIATLLNDIIDAQTNNLDGYVAGRRVGFEAVPRHQEEDAAPERSYRVLGEKCQCCGRERR
jgi:hypothetical protein